MHMELLTCAFDACSKRLLSSEDEEVLGACTFRADAESSDGEAAAECMGRLVLHALVHGIAPPLSLNPAVYACALGSALATPTDFGAHDYSWWSGTAGEGAMGRLGRAAV